MASFGNLPCLLLKIQVVALPAVSVCIGYPKMNNREQVSHIYPV